MLSTHLENYSSHHSVTIGQNINCKCDQGVCGYKLDVCKEYGTKYYFNTQVNFPQYFWYPKMGVYVPKVL